MPFWNYELFIIETTLSLFDSRAGNHHEEDDQQQIPE